MDRKDFLKSACGAGACGCALGLLGAPRAQTQAETPKPAAEPPPEARQLAFNRYQVANMVKAMAADLPPAAAVGVLRKTGRECAKITQVHAKYQGNPEGYFAACKEAWGTEVAWDKKQGLVTVTVPAGECSCPLVSTKWTPPLFCNCSAGYQEEALGAVFGKPVTVELVATKLAGSPNCVFRVKVS